MLTLQQQLKRNDIKVTHQRIAVYNYLLNTTSHPNAETIYKALSPQHPNMSLATVYKTLGKLCKAHLAQELNVGEDSFRYDANYLPHPHFICSECGCVTDLPVPDNLKKLREDMEALSECTILFEQIYYYGFCGACTPCKNNPPTQSS